MKRARKLDSTISAHFEALAKDESLTVDEIIGASPWHAVLEISDDESEVVRDVSEYTNWGLLSTSVFCNRDGLMMRGKVALHLSLTCPQKMLKGRRNGASLYVKTFGGDARASAHQTVLNPFSFCSNEFSVNLKTRDKAAHRQAGGTPQRGSSDEWVAQILEHGSDNCEDLTSAFVLLCLGGVGSSLRQQRLGGGAQVRVHVNDSDFGRLESKCGQYLTVLCGLGLIVLAVVPRKGSAPVEMGDSVDLQLRVLIHKNIATLCARLSRGLDHQARDVFVTAFRYVVERLSTKVRKCFLRNVVEQAAAVKPSTTPSSTAGESEGPMSDETVEPVSEVDEESSRQLNDLVLGREKFVDTHPREEWPGTCLHEAGTSCNCVFWSSLRPYQVEGVRWMIGREDQTKQGTPDEVWDYYGLSSDSAVQFAWLNYVSGEVCVNAEPVGGLARCRGGILSDEMGLGKTVEVLALIANDYINFDAAMSDANDINGSTEAEESIAEKSSASTQNVTEAFRTKASFVGNGNLLVVPLSLVDQWVGEIKRHVKRKFSVQEFHGTERKADADIVITTYGTVLSQYQKAFVERNGSSCSLLYTRKWRRVILDEAHLIKNRLAKTTKAICAIPSDLRWCVTGSPIQNALADLYPLLVFLKSEPWNQLVWWARLVEARGAANELEDTSKVRKVVGPLMLRRTRETIDKTTGQPIVKLPQLHITRVWLEFDEELHRIYKMIHQSAVSALRQYVQQRGESKLKSASGGRKSTFTSMLLCLLRLRQVCCHPILTISRELDESTEDLQSEQLDKGREQLNENECPICLEPITRTTLLPCGHVFCLGCLRTALGLKPELNEDFAGSRFGSVIAGNITTVGERTYHGLCPMCRAHFTTKTMKTDYNSGERLPVSGWAGSLAALEWSELTTPKLTVALTLIRNVTSRGYKVVVFSQWTSLLDVIQEALRRISIITCRLDGTMTKEKRQAQIELFSRGVRPKVALTDAEVTEGIRRAEPCSPKGSTLDPLPEPPLPTTERATVNDAFRCEFASLAPTAVPGIKENMVLLSSLKAGGVGLNLVAANYLIMLDSWWNPAAEKQAMQRVHRIGQTLPVHVYTLHMIESIEGKILALHETKEQRSEGVMSGATRGSGAAAARTGVEDVAFLLKDD